MRASRKRPIRLLSVVPFFVSLAPASAQLGEITSCYGSGQCTVDPSNDPLTYYSLVANSQCIETDESCQAVSVVGCNIAPALGEACRSCYATCGAALSYLSRQGLANGDLVNFCASSALAGSTYCASCQDSARCPQQTPSPTPVPTQDGTTPAPATPAPSTAAPTAPLTPAPTVKAPPSINAMLLGTLTLPSEAVKKVEERRLQLRRRQPPQPQRQRRRLDTAGLERAMAAFFDVESSDVYAVDGEADPTDYLGTTGPDNQTASAVVLNNTTSTDFVVAYYGADAKQQAQNTLDWLQERGSWVALAALLSISPEDAVLTKISSPVTATDSAVVYEGPWTAPAAASSGDDNGPGGGTAPTGDTNGGSGGSGGTWWTYVVAASGAVALLLGVLYAGMVVRRRRCAQIDLPKFKSSFRLSSPGRTVRALSVDGGSGGGFSLDGNEEYKTQTPGDCSSASMFSEEGEGGYASPPGYDAPRLPSDAAAAAATPPSPAGSAASSGVYGGVPDGGGRSRGMAGLAPLAVAAAAAAGGLAISSSSSSPRGAHGFSKTEASDDGGGGDGADESVGSLGSRPPSSRLSGSSYRFGGPGSAFDSRQQSSNAFSMRSTGEGLRPTAWSPSSRGASQARGGIHSTASGASSASASPSVAAMARRISNRGGGGGGGAAHSPAGSEDSAWQRAWMVGRNFEQRFFGGGPRTPTRGAMERAREQAAPWR